jgi:hypothetical protein
MRSLLTFTLLSLTLLVTGCSTINTEPMEHSDARLSPNPPKIYVAPFNIETAQWLVDRGEFPSEREDFKREYQMKFARILEERLQKVAPTELRWTDLPHEGWLVAGEFVKVYQGSRALRFAVGFGAGETVLQTRVYVYDLSKSRDRYVLSFFTGVRDPKRGTGAGSGHEPKHVSAFTSGLRWDAIRTARAIRDILMTYR